MGAASAVSVSVPAEVVVAVPAVYDRPVRAEYRFLADLRLSHPELSVKQLSELVGYSYQTIRAWLVRPDYQRYEHWVFTQQFAEAPAAAAAKKEAVQEAFTAHAAEMQERLLAILDSTANERLAADLAKDWLDRAGHVAVRKIQHASVSVTFTADALRELSRREAEAGLLPEGTVDGSLVE